MTSHIHVLSPAGQLRRCAAPVFTFGYPAKSVEPVGSIKSPNSKNKKATIEVAFLFLLAETRSRTRRLINCFASVCASGFSTIPHFLPHIGRLSPA